MQSQFSLCRRGKTSAREEKKAAGCARFRETVCECFVKAAPASHALEYALVPVYERRDTETEAGDDHGRIATAKSRDSFSRISRARTCVYLSFRLRCTRPMYTRLNKTFFFETPTSETLVKTWMFFFVFLFFFGFFAFSLILENRFSFHAGGRDSFRNVLSRLRLGVFNTFYIILHEREWVKGVVSFEKIRMKRTFSVLSF